MENANAWGVLYEKLDWEAGHPPPDWEIRAAAKIPSMVSDFLHSLKEAAIPEALAHVLCESESLLTNFADFWDRPRCTGFGAGDIGQATEMFLEETWQFHRCDIFHARLAEEYEVFREEMLSLPKEEIMNRAYQIADREDILFLFDTHEFEPADIETLLTLENPLEEIYRERCDFFAFGHGMDDMLSCVEQVITTVQERPGEYDGHYVRASRLSVEALMAQGMDMNADQDDELER